MDERSIHLHVSDEELAKRRANWKAPEPHYSKGVMAKYAKLLAQAHDGAVTG